MKKAVVQLFLSLTSLLLLQSSPNLLVEGASTSAASKKTTSQKTYETTTSRRERNLDHWDAETLAYYLGIDPITALPVQLRDDPSTSSSSTYAGIDASVMFYAQWCKNCHKFAPIWDTIATLLHAGTSRGNIIMALFNCELNEQHSNLCNAAGVTHYPTLMHIGAGNYPHADPVTRFISKRTGGSGSGSGSEDSAEGPFGPSLLDRTIKFQGNYAVGDSVLDWIKTMKGMSTWYRWNHFEGGWLKKVRDFFTGMAMPGMKKMTKKGKKDKYSALPVGVPPSANGGRTTSGGGTNDDGGASAYQLKKELDEKESKLTKMEEQLKDHKNANTHAGYLIESFLFPTPPSADSPFGNEFIDPFVVMARTNAWEDLAAISPAPTTPEEKEELETRAEDALVLKSCVVDLTLDYCSRFSSKLTTDYLDSLKTVTEDQEYPSFMEMEKHLKNLVQEIEPYCAIFNTCYNSEFKSSSSVGLEGGENECRPQACPFRNFAGACRYVASCMTDSIQEEYKTALSDAATKLEKEGGTTA